MLIQLYAPLNNNIICFAEFIKMFLQYQTSKADWVELSLLNTILTVLNWIITIKYVTSAEHKDENSVWFNRKYPAAVNTGGKFLI